jgi:hypothetical protein
MSEEGDTGDLSPCVFEPLKGLGPDFSRLQIHLAFGPDKIFKKE